MLISITIIVVAVFGIELWADFMYPTEELQIVTPMHLEGFSGNWDYFKDGSKVGIHSYYIKKEGQNYIINSSTRVSFEGNILYLESMLNVDEKLKPIRYNLNAIQKEQVTRIMTNFQGNLAVTTVEYEGEKTSLEESVSDETFLIDNIMLGHWEVFLASANLERGYKYEVSIFSPQLSSNILVTLVVDKKTSQVSIGENELDCLVINVDVLELSLYIFEGELVQFRVDNQGLMLKKHP